MEQIKKKLTSIKQERDDAIDKKEAAEKQMKEAEEKLDQVYSSNTIQY